MTEDKVIDSGGPAFPLDLVVGNDHSWGHGMTLRDYFAAAAMTGMYARRAFEPEHMAQYAYEQADAMIAHRSK
jgi:hypothetical protein